MAELTGAPRQADQTTDYSLTLPVVVMSVGADDNDDPPRLFAGHRAILADAELKAMGLHKQHAMTTLLQSYEFGLPPPQYSSGLDCRAVENLAARQLVAQSRAHQCAVGQAQGTFIATKCPATAE